MKREMERETRLELATPTLARWLAKASNPLRRKEYSNFEAGCKPRWRHAFEIVADALWVAFLVLLALTWFVGLFLVGWIPDAKAEVIFETMSRKNAGWRIWSRPEADDHPVPVCRWVSYDVLVGEHIKIDGFAQVDAESDLIGQNVQIAYCDENEPQCRYTGRWDLPSVHFWDAGNVAAWTNIPGSTLKVPGEHHKIGRPTALYVSPRYQRKVEFQVFVNTYAPTPRWSTVNDCGMILARYRD